MGSITLLLTCWSFDWAVPVDRPQGVHLQTQGYATFLIQLLCGFRELLESIYDSTCHAHTKRLKQYVLSYLTLANL